MILGVLMWVWVWWCGVCSRWTDLGISWFGYFLVVLGGFVWFCCACGSVLVWVVGVLVFVCDFRCGLLRCRPSGVVFDGFGGLAFCDLRSGVGFLDLVV